MDQIIEPSPDFNFSKVSCSPPNNIGGSYFTRLFYNNKPMYIQTPKSLTKQGIIKGKKINYSDLLFTSEDTLFIQWIEDLEENCRNLIHENSSRWFETTLDKGDIEEAFNSIIKIYKSGKNYLVRTNIKDSVRIYDDSNNNIDQSSLKNTSYLISILEFQGIKFTARNFQILIEMKQAMIVSPDPFQDECFIKTPFKKNRNNSNNENNDYKKEIHFNNSNNINDNILNSLDINKISTNTLEEKTSSDLDKQSNDENYLEDNVINEVELKQEEHEEQEEEQEEEAKDLEEIKDLNRQTIDLDFTDDFPKEYEIEMPSLEDSITLKNPNQVYYDLYKQAREKAKKAKKEAIIAYLEAKELKNTHILDIEDEDSDSDLEYNLNSLA